MNLAATLARVAIVICLALGIAHSAQAESAPQEQVFQLMAQARLAARNGDWDAALARANEAVQASPDKTECYVLRATIYESRDEYEAACEDLTRWLRLEPTSAEAFDRRGGLEFKRGHVREAISDFDRAIQLDARREPWHWKRGISYYFAEKYPEGCKQFEGYQSVDDSDVENAVWRFLCMAKKDGIDKARQSILKIGPDKRVPMREVYDLFAGKTTPDAVLAAARAGDPSPEDLNQQLFYAYQYLGLYHEALGDKVLAEKYTRQAVEHRISHYMWDVARVHVQLRTASGEWKMGKEEGRGPRAEGQGERKR